MNKAALRAFVVDHKNDYDRNENPFASSAWLLNWIDHCAAPEWDFHVLGRTLFYSTPESPRNWQCLSNYYSSQFSPMSDAALRPRADTVTISPIAENESVPFGFGWYVRRYQAFGNYFLPCVNAMTYAEYLEARPSQLKNTLARKGKQFKGRLEVITKWDENAVKAYNAIYAASWKQPEPYPEFVPGWMKVCAENGWLRLGIAWLDEVPIAAQFWFVRHWTAYIYKLAYREEYQKHSAGSLLSAKLFEHVIDEDMVCEVDYLTGDDAYKQAWMSERRQRVGLIACNLKSPLGIVRAGRELAGAAVKRVRARMASRALPC